MEGMQDDKFSEIPTSCSTATCWSANTIKQPRLGRAKKFENQRSLSHEKLPRTVLQKLLTTSWLNQPVPLLINANRHKPATSAATGGKTHRRKKRAFIRLSCCKFALADGWRWVWYFFVFHQLAPGPAFAVVITSPCTFFPSGRLTSIMTIKACQMLQGKIGTYSRLEPPVRFSLCYSGFRRPAGNHLWLKKINHQKNIPSWW